MPTVLRLEAFRFYFYASDCDEPEHVHVERAGKVAKFWLKPVRLHRSGGFSRSEIARVQRMVADHQEELLEAWNEYFHGSN